MKHEEWIEDIRRAARDAEAEVPAGGWERLAEALEAEPVRRAVPLWLRIAGVAAVFAGLVATGGYLFFNRPAGVEESDALLAAETSDSVEAAADIAAVIGEVSQPDSSAAEAEAPVSEPSFVAAAETAKAEDTDSAADAQAEVLPAAECIANTEDVSVLAESQSEPESEPEIEPESEPASRRDDRPDSGYLKYMDEASSKTFVASADKPDKKERGRILAGAFVNGVQTFSGSDAAPLTVPADAFGTNMGAQSVVNGRARYSYKHRVPLSFGITLGKEFKYGLALETGVTYSYLRADVTVAPGVPEILQQAHFIGVPLRLNWNFVRAHGLGAYIGAGFMMEKCVGAKFGSDKIDIKPLHWSVTGAIGLQYTFAKYINVFFEPEVSYYINQRRISAADIHTTYTDSPLTLTLRLGMRFSY